MAHIASFTATPSPDVLAYLTKANEWRTVQEMVRDTKLKGDQVRHAATSLVRRHLVVREHPVLHTTRVKQRYRVC